MDKLALPYSWTCPVMILNIFVSQVAAVPASPSGWPADWSWSELIVVPLCLN